MKFMQFEPRLLPLMKGEVRRGLKSSNLPLAPSFIRGGTVTWGHSNES